MQPSFSGERLYFCPYWRKRKDSGWKWWGPWSGLRSASENSKTLCWKINYCYICQNSVCVLGFSVRFLFYFKMCSPCVLSPLPPVLFLLRWLPRVFHLCGFSLSCVLFVIIPHVFKPVFQFILCQVVCSVDLVPVCFFLVLLNKYTDIWAYPPVPLTVTQVRGAGKFSPKKPLFVSFMKQKEILYQPNELTKLTR